MSRTVERLPWELERLVQAAISRELGIPPMRDIPNPSSYVLATAASYRISGDNYAIECLYNVYRHWPAAPKEDNGG